MPKDFYTGESIHVPDPVPTRDVTAEDAESNSQRRQRILRGELTPAMRRRVLEMYARRRHAAPYDETNDLSPEDQHRNAVERRAVEGPTGWNTFPSPKPADADVISGADRKTPAKPAAPVPRADAVSGADPKTVAAAEALAHARDMHRIQALVSAETLRQAYNTPFRPGVDDPATMTHQAIAQILLAPVAQYAQTANPVAVPRHMHVQSENFTPSDGPSESPDVIKIPNLESDQTPFISADQGSE